MPLPCSCGYPQSLPEADRLFLQNLSELLRSNPFSAEWVDNEKRTLGNKFQQPGTIHLWGQVKGQDPPNIKLLSLRTEKLAKKLLANLDLVAKSEPDFRRQYQYLIVYLLYRRYHESFDHLIAARDQKAAEDLWRDFANDFKKHFHTSETETLTKHSPEHLFALLFQMRRAFRHIFDYIAGSSDSVIQLREQVWNSIFTHDIQQYMENMYERMSNFNTLITGESGTGKELVARAIGMSQYIAFDSRKKQFKADFAKSFRAVNLGGMPRTLIESELFGHVQGAFTGADRDHQGWLETANNSDALFLDEIGELDHSIQVKLLRAIETRTFFRVGDQKKKTWKGKIIAATNRDLIQEVHKGRFRKDLYYRICGDVILTPTLRAQLDESPNDLKDLARFAIKRVVGDDCDSVAETVKEYFENHDMHKHTWPGNFRELEQCVRNIVIRGHYNHEECARYGDFDSIEDALSFIAEEGLSAKELKQVYCAVVYNQEGQQYEAAGKRLKMVGRTVKKHVEAYEAMQDNLGVSGNPQNIR